MCGIEREWWTYVICNDEGLIKIIWWEAAEQSIWPARRQGWQCWRHVPSPAVHGGGEASAGQGSVVWLERKARLRVCTHPIPSSWLKAAGCCSVLNSGWPPSKVIQHEMLRAFSPFSWLIYLYVYQLIHTVSIYLALYPLAPADI